MKFKKGDIIISQQNVEIEIVKVYKTFYKWKYLDSGEIFDTINSNDPLLKWWRLKE